MSLETRTSSYGQTERQLTETGGSGGGPSLRPAPITTAGRGCEHRSRRVHLISEELFRSALRRERRIADRTNQHIAVLVVRIAPAAVTAACVWDAAVEALAAARRPTEILGWLEHGAALGLIISHPEGTGAEFERRVREELCSRLDPAAAARFSIKLHQQHDPRQAPADPVNTVEFLLDGSAAATAHAGYERLKRVLDFVLALGLLVALSPLLLAVALLVKLTSRGPVLFRQQRIGQYARPFTMLKFRTMRAGANHAVHQDYVTWFIKASNDAGAGKPALFKIANDPRVTPIGRFLRRTSLDELPQLWNVVRGDMSLVGPRPPLPYEVEQYKSWHCRRVLDAKPGITGLWQVAGRSQTTFDEMVRLDLRYARTRSLGRDLRILLATPLAVIGGKGAC